MTDDLAVRQEVRLSDLEFTDLYISQQGEVLLRGAGDGKEPLVAVPPGVIVDLRGMVSEIFSKGQYQREFFIDWDRVRYRVSQIRAQGDTWYTLRRSKSVIPRLQDLGGFSAPVIRHLAWLGRHHGLIVVSGATGQGKTTTACALLRQYLVSFGDIAVTIEDPPEMILEGAHGNFGRCFQLRLEGEDFGSALVAALRYTPRYIFMGELRKSNDASEALRAAISGHLVITTIHAGSIEETLNSLIKLTSSAVNHEFARELLADGLAGVIHQTLVRTTKGVRLQVKTLFPGNDKGIRSLIRDGTINQLATHIDQQARRIAKGEPPVVI
jgi:Tfp pilus assembly protein, pilus retraction ATPase PilT